MKAGTRAHRTAAIGLESDRQIRAGLDKRREAAAARPGPAAPYPCESPAYKAPALIEDDGKLNEGDEFTGGVGLGDKNRRSSSTWLVRRSSTG